MHWQYGLLILPILALYFVLKIRTKKKKDD